MLKCIECSADRRYCGHSQAITGFEVIPACPKCKTCTLEYGVCPACTNKAKQKMAHGCDGPITDFVVISRGCELLANGEFGSKEIANAIAETLQEWGFMPRENSVYPTGS